MNTQAQIYEQINAKLERVMFRLAILKAEKKLERKTQ